MGRGSRESEGRWVEREDGSRGETGRERERGEMGREGKWVERRER